jgi:hypothetical protein
MSDLLVSPSHVLWNRTTLRPREGSPDFGRVHPLRQRRAMRRLLCQVCAGPADKSDDGVLWLLQDHRADWADWPEAMVVTEPPVCLPCVRTSIRLCPALRKGPAVVRVRHYPIYGVQGVLYKSGVLCPTAAAEVIAPFDDPAITWIRAAHLVRELHGCTFLPPTEFVD